MSVGGMVEQHLFCLPLQTTTYWSFLRKRPSPPRFNQLQLLESPATACAPPQRAVEPVFAVDCVSATLELLHQQQTQRCLEDKGIRRSTTVWYACYVKSGHDDCTRGGCPAS